MKFFSRDPFRFEEDPKKALANFVSALSLSFVLRLMFAVQQLFSQHCCCVASNSCYRSVVVDKPERVALTHAHL